MWVGGWAGAQMPPPPPLRVGKQWPGRNQGPEIPTTGSLSEDYSQVWDNMGGGMGEDVSFLEN